MRFLMTSVALLALVACAPSTPEGSTNSGSGVGFGSYDEYQARRDAQLAGNGLPAPHVVTATPLGGAGSDADDLAAQTRAALGGDAAASVGDTGRAVVQAGSNTPAPQVSNSPGISAENNFDAVSSSRSIQDDAARVAAQQQQYQVAAVEALPTRSSDGPNIVAYAISTKHAPGTQVYKRGGLLNNQAKHERNCAAYSGPDLAQIDFLSKGGPERDRLALDPDGDGFACSWDPRPFRKAAGG